MGRALGRLLGVGPERMLTLQAAGAAAGIAAGFNVAIAGVFFAFETVFRQDSVGGGGKEGPSLPFCAYFQGEACVCPAHARMHMWQGHALSNQSTNRPTNLHPRAQRSKRW